MKNPHYSQRKCWIKKQIQVIIKLKHYQLLELLCCRHLLRHMHFTHAARNIGQNEK